MHLRPLTALLFPLALAAADDPPAPQPPPEPAASTASPADPATDTAHGPFGQFMHDLRRAISGRQAVATVHPDPPPTDSRTDIHQPFQLIPTNGNLFGDWFGLRTALNDKGITPSISFVTNLAGNVSGGRDQGFTHADNLDMSFTFDFEKMFGINGASFIVDMAQRSGSSLSSVYIGNLFTVQQVFGGSTFHLVDLAWQQKLFDDRFEFRVGRIAAGDDFLVSEYDYLFMQNAFDGNPVGIFFNSPGMTAYPNATWGFLGKFNATQRLSMLVGVYNGDPSIRANAYNGANFTLNGPVFVIGELQYQVNALKDDTGPIGNYKLGFWYDNSVYTNFGTANTTRGNYGIYGLFDQLVLPFGDPHESRGLGIFGSILASPDQSISAMPYFFTAGLAARGMFSERPDDIAGLGFVYGSASNDLANAQRQAQILNPAIGVQSYEAVLELTYRINFPGNSVFFQPDIQYIFNPGAANQFSNALVLGCQIGVNF